MPERDTLTVTNVHDEQEITFEAVTFGDTRATFNIHGPANICLDQIEVTPSHERTGDVTYCGVALNFTQTSEYDTHLGSLLTISPEDERRLVGWLHGHGARGLVIQTRERRTASLNEASRRGKCAGCETYFKDGTTWGVTLHRDDDHDLHFCTEACFDASNE